MSIKLHDWLHRFHRDHEGGLSAEYVAVLIVIGAIVAALWQAGIQDKVDDCGKKSADAIFKMDGSKDKSPC